MTVANSKRGEVAIKLGGEDKVLRPSFEAMCAIEEQLGSILTLAMRAAQRGNPLDSRELSIIITEGMRAFGKAEGTPDKDTSARKVRELMYADGVASFAAPVIVFLGNMIKGGAADDAPGKD